MTPADVLNIFTEQHRLISPLDPEADETEHLTMSSRICDWRDANDLLPWQPLSKALDEEFEIGATVEEWRLVLTPSRGRTLQDVCNFISERCPKTDIRPVKLFGKECLSAAIFQSLKRNLSQKNIDCKGITPSSDIKPYLDKHLGELIIATTLLSKGRPVFDSFKPELKKSGFWNYINIFDRDRYTYPTGGVKTFRDLTMKILEANKAEPPTE